MLHPGRLLTRITAPGSEPITLAEAKLYLRVDTHHEDTLISDFIVAVRMDAESFLRRSLITQTWKASFGDYEYNNVPLPMGPVIAVTEVLSRNVDGSSQEIGAEHYYINAARNGLVFASLVSGAMLEISYSAGYGDASAVPKPIKMGMLSHIAALYDARGEAQMPQQANSLYAPFREVRL